MVSRLAKILKSSWINSRKRNAPDKSVKLILLMPISAQNAILNLALPSTLLKLYT